MFPHNFIVGNVHYKRKQYVLFSLKGDLFALQPDSLIDVGRQLRQN